MYDRWQRLHVATIGRPGAKPPFGSVWVTFERCLLLGRNKMHSQATIHANFRSSNFLRANSNSISIKIHHNYERGKLLPSRLSFGAKVIIFAGGCNHRKWGGLECFPIRNDSNLLYNFCNLQKIYTQQLQLLFPIPIIKLSLLSTQLTSLYSSRSTSDQLLELLHYDPSSPLIQRSLESYLKSIPFQAIHLPLSPPNQTTDRNPPTHPRRFFIHVAPTVSCPRQATRMSIFPTRWSQQ